jgi:hypothetical protein
VLVAGGSSQNVDQTSAELYNPANDSWGPAGDMRTARAAQTATLLLTGQVLVAGGQGAGFSALASAELYSP